MVVQYLRTETIHGKRSKPNFWFEQKCPIFFKILLLSLRPSIELRCYKMMSWHSFGTVLYWKRVWHCFEATMYFNMQWLQMPCGFAKINAKRTLGLSKKKSRSAEQWQFQKYQGNGFLHHSPCSFENGKDLHAHILSFIFLMHNYCETIYRKKNYRIGHMPKRK